MIDPRKLVVGTAYVNRAGGWPSSRETLYYTDVFDDLMGATCDRCGKSLEGKKAYAFGFDRDPEWKRGGVYLGSECVKKLSLMAEAVKEESMRRLIESLESMVIEGTPFGAPGWKRGKSDPIAKRDAAMAAKRKAKMSWEAEPNEQYERYRLFYDGTVEYGRVERYKEDEASSPWRIWTIIPGGHGRLQKGDKQYATKALAQAAVEKAVG